MRVACGQQCFQVLFVAVCLMRYRHEGCGFALDVRGFAVMDQKHRSAGLRYSAEQEKGQIDEDHARCRALVRDLVRHGRSR